MPINYSCKHFDIIVLCHFPTLVFDYHALNPKLNLLFIQGLISVYQSPLSSLF